MIEKAHLKIFLLTALCLAVFSCSSTEKTVKKPLPPNNVKDINSVSDDLGPVQKPAGKTGICDPCNMEFASYDSDSLEGMNSSSHFINAILGSFIEDSNRTKAFEYFITNNAEAITFLTENSGFFSISHLPDFISAGNLGLPVSLPLEGHFGGTDIYEFNYDTNKYIIKNLEANSNTIFWDSHPYAIQDTNCNTLLIWSSDRDHPYNFLYDTDGNKKEIGNTDLFFNFRDKDGNWGEPQSFSTVSKEINTAFNEETPFIYCLCHKAKIFFASNRNNKNYDDYDIYSISLKIDFENREISLATNAALKQLPKGKDMINTDSKEFFPYISKPYSEESPESYIYLSSDRYTDGSQRYESKGGFDIYRYQLEGYECKPPKIFYDYVILDTLNPERPVVSPIAVLYETDDDGNETEIDRKTSAKGSFELMPWKNYNIKGGSRYDDIACESGKDSIIWYYEIRNITLNRIDTVKEYSEISYEQVLERKKTVRTDTTYTITASPEEFAELQADRGKRIVSTLEQDGSYIVTINEKITEKVTVPYDTLERVKKLPIYKQVYIYDTNYVKSSASRLNESVRTTYSPLLFGKLSDDIYIKDTIYLWPRYYHYPECEWKYVRHEIDFRRNVPYFQTCFWEVNTSANLESHINRMNSSKSDIGKASFIELHPNNHYFGYKKPGISSAKYYRRIYKYRRFAQAVDSNIAEMAMEIGKNILPGFESYDSISVNNNKLLIMIDAYSDKRPIGGESARYIAKKGKIVDYMAVSYDTVQKDIKKVYPVHIMPEASLRGESNDTLSKLRVYFGYLEILKKLEEYDIFKRYMNDSGIVLLPHQIKSEKEFWEQFDKSKIIFMIEGKQFDPTVTPIHEGYINKKGDYAALDTVRRINMVVNRVVVSGRSIDRPGCCKQTPAVPEYLMDRYYAQIKRHDGTVEGLGYFISFGAYRNKNNAKMLVDFLKKNSITDIEMRKIEIDGSEVYLVLSKIFPKRNLAEAALTGYSRILKDFGQPVTPELRQE